MLTTRVPGQELGAALLGPHRDPKDSDDPSEQDGDLSLPPLDDDNEDAGPEPDFDDLLTPLEDETADPFDDATASDLETGVDVGGEETIERSVDDDEASDGVDVGPLDEGMTVRDSFGDEGNEQDGEGAEDDFELSPDTRGEDDGGVEGTEENIEDDVNEEDLPSLDADEAGDFEAEDVVAEMTFEMDAALPAWDARRWSVLNGAGATLPCSALAVAAGRVAAGGEVVLVVDEGANAARRAGFEGGASSVALTGEGVLVVAHRGHLWLSKDGGTTAAAVVGFRAGRGRVELGATAGRLWILSEGSLYSMPEAGGRVIAAPDRDKDTRAIAATGTVIVALTHSAAGPSIERLRGDDEGWLSTNLSGTAKEVASSRSALITAAGGGRLIALADGETLCVSRDFGVTFAEIALPGVVALTFAGDQKNAPVLALLVRGVLETAVVSRVSADGVATRIADLPSFRGSNADDDDDTDLGAVSMAWDAAREVVWVACPAGLLALARTRKH